MIEKVPIKVVGVVKNNDEEYGQKNVRKLNSDLVRSPETDCFRFTNPINAPKALISHEQALEKIANTNLEAIDDEEFFLISNLSRDSINKLTSQDVDTSHLITKLRAKSEIEKDNLLRIEIKKIDSQNRTIHVEYKFKDGGSETLLVDESGKELLNAKTTLKVAEEGKETYTSNIQDYRNNSSSVAKYSHYSPTNDILINETKIIRDKAGKILKTEYTVPSEVEGIYDVKSVDANGKVKILSSGTKDKNGCVTIKKDLESLNGTKTNYEYHGDPLGNRHSTYKIIDKDGKILLDDKQEFEVVDENNAISIHNGKKFEIKTENDFFKLHDLESDQYTFIDIEELIKGPKVELTNVLKKVNADELLKIYKSGVKLKSVDTVQDTRLVYDGTTDTIQSIANMFTVGHEFTHTEDLGSKGLHISENDEKFKKIFKEEKDAFLNAFPVQQRYMRKYIDEIQLNEREPVRIDGEHDGVADSGALLNNGYVSVIPIATREHYFQQYFPRTIAYVNKVLGS